jgi:MFS family permease
MCSEKDALDSVTGYVQFATTIALGSLGFALTVPSAFTDIFHANVPWLIAARVFLIFSWACFVVALYAGIRAWGTIAGMMIDKVGKASDERLAGFGILEVFSLLAGVVALAIAFLIANFVPEPLAVRSAEEAVTRALTGASISPNVVTSISPRFLASADTREPTWQITIGYHVGARKHQRIASTEVFLDATDGTAYCVPPVGHCSLPIARP